MTDYHGLAWLVVALALVPGLPGAVLGGLFARLRGASPGRTALGAAIGFAVALAVGLALTLLFFRY